MQAKSGASGVTNFLKVAGAAMLHPTRIITGGLVVGTAIALPAIALPALIAGGIAIVGMSWADINDPEFISRVLRPAPESTPSYTKRLTKLTEELRQQVNERDTYPEVKEDVDAAVDAIKKIIDVISYLPASEQGSISFVVDQLEKLTTRLKQLLTKEQLARKFLQTENRQSLTNELRELEVNAGLSVDKITQDQINKAIIQAQEQITNYEQVQQRLGRIDAYIANIRGALYTTYSNLARLQLKDDYVLVDEADVLTDSIKQIVNEIDTFESLSVDIATEMSIEQDKQTKKTKTKIN
jgi:hypothetical protein